MHKYQINLEEIIRQLSKPKAEWKIFGDKDLEGDWESAVSDRANANKIQNTRQIKSPWSAWLVDPMQRIRNNWP